MILQSRRVWVLNTWLQAQVEYSEESGKITVILPYGERAADEDFGDLRVVPGFIDVHTHGAGGFDTNDADDEGLRRWAKSLVEEGVTGFLPTTVTQSEEVLTAALRSVARVAHGQSGHKGTGAAYRSAGPCGAPSAGAGSGGAGIRGARILGIHFEGPYLDQKFKGAQPEQYCVRPDLDQFRRYWEASEGLIRIATVACEHDEGFALTKWMTEQGIAVSLGHSCASYEQAAMAFANGVRSVTHVFNGMAPFHHRSPGIVGAAMRFRNVFGEAICDGNHSAWASLNDFFTVKGPDYGILITDSLRVKGLPAGTQVRFGGNLIELCEDGCARLVTGDAGSARLGNIAGSTLRVNEGLRNLVEKAEVPWQTAINACTLNPARLLGMEGIRGTIQAGKAADMVVLRDDYSVKAVFIGGTRQF